MAESASFTFDPKDRSQPLLFQTVSHWQYAEERVAQLRSEIS
jgi:hypothetical protein